MDELGKAYVELEDAQNKYTEALKEQLETADQLEEAEYEIYRIHVAKDLGENETVRKASVAQLTDPERSKKYNADKAVIDARGMFENAKRKVEYEKIIRGVPF